jgi:hypothetical protein
MVNEMGTAWKDRFPDALWTYRTAYKTPIGMSTYQLVCGKTFHLLVELEFKAHWVIRMSIPKGCSAEGFHRQATTRHQAAPSKGQRDADRSKAR